MIILIYSKYFWCLQCPLIQVASLLGTPSLVNFILTQRYLVGPHNYYYILSWGYFSLCNSFSMPASSSARVFILWNHLYVVGTDYSLVCSLWVPSLLESPPQIILYVLKPARSKFSLDYNRYIGADVPEVCRITCICGESWAKKMSLGNSK